MRISGPTEEDGNTLVIEGELDRIDVPTLDVNGEQTLNKIIVGFVRMASRTDKVNSIRITCELNPED